jgi:photosystem II stability/assembly factor-like uncharacterized protein
VSTLRLSRAVSIALVLPVAAFAQGRGGGRGAAPGAQAPDTSYDVLWRNIGPNQTSRMTAVAGSTARPNEYYMGTTGGGVWKTTDGGQTAIPVTDDYFGGTIGALAVQESNPDVVWSGGGETPIRGNVSHGEGVWKTTDAGKTWQLMGLKETQYISRIRIHPTNPDIVYVAALGHVFGPNPERGVFKTTDGGRTWNKILFRNDSTGVIDLIFDPSNPNTLYAALWQAGRTPWMLVSGGEGSGIFKTTDGGATWTEISRNPGLPPTGLLGKIGIAVSPAKPSRVWALIEHEPGGGVYRSDDAGATWTFLSGNRNLRQRAWYYTTLYADPADTNVVYGPNVSPSVSRDGGRTFGAAFGGGDNHDMWIDPKNPRRIAVAHDNGVVITTDGGTTRTAVQVPTGQYYHVHLTNHFPVYQVCGAKQDAGTSCGPVRMGGGGGRGGRGGGGGAAATPASPFSEFTGVAGGESGYVSSNPKNPDITYGANYSGSLDVQDRRTGVSTSIDPWPLNPMGHDAKDSKYRFQWTFPIVHSPFAPNTIYVGSNVLFKTTDGGFAWSIISPDLTRNDPRTLGSSGGPITKDQTSVEYYGTIFTVDESPITPGVIWTGSDDGLIQLTRDGGKTWKNVTPPGTPEWMRWSIIEASPHAAGTLWAAGNRYQMDDFRPYLYKTTDYGVTWTKIVNGIPDDQFTRAIREDLLKPNLVYAATERSMYYSYDGGRNWKSLKKNLPPVPVHDIALKDDDLVIATHGRAFWAMENLTPLRYAPEAEAAIAGNRPYLYKPAPIYRQGTASPTFVYRQPTAGETVKFEFLDKNGKQLGTFASNDTTPAPAAGGAGGGGGGGGRGGGGGGPARPTNRAGINRFTWTMRYPDATRFNGMIMWQGSTTGPAMPPGMYWVKLTVGNGAPISHTFLVKPDPRTGATEADLVEQARLGLMIRDRTTDANNAVITIRNIKRDLIDRTQKMPGDAAFERMATALADSLSVVEDSLYQTKNQSGQDPLNFPVRLNNQIAALSGFVNGNDRRPPKQAYDVYNTLEPKLTRELLRLRRFIAGDLARVNTALKAKGVEEIVPSVVEPPGGGGRGGGRGGGPLSQPTDRPVFSSLVNESVLRRSPSRQP